MKFPEKTIDDYALMLKTEFISWEKAYKYGRFDPFWEDGMALNLIRNHIISIKNDINELIENEDKNSLFKREYPDIYYKETPPEVDYTYMAQPDKIRELTNKELALYEQDENYLFLLDMIDILYPDKQNTKESKEAGLPYYAIIGLRKYRECIEQDDLVSMRRNFRTPYEKQRENWKQYADTVKSFLAQENSRNDTESMKDNKEPLNQKIQSANTEQQKQKEQKEQKEKHTQKPQRKDRASDKEYQMSLF